MISLEQQAGTSPFTSAPPPPPKDATVRSSMSTVPTFSNSPTRIKRKPLPATTSLSPLSVLSSPDSIYSQYAAPSRHIETPASVAVLNQVLDSGVIEQVRDPMTVSRTNTPPSSDATLTSNRGVRDFGNISKTNLVNDFPVPPRSDTRAHKHANSFMAKREGPTMAIGGRSEMRPPPLRMESLRAVKAVDARKPQSPGSVFTSFFSRRQNTSPQVISPDGDSSITDISEGRSADPSPNVGLAEDHTNYFSQTPAQIPYSKGINSSRQSLDSENYETSRQLRHDFSAQPDIMARCSALELELREISKELAGSIRRELDLEDLVDRLQAEAPLAPMSADRTSDYFSDSGTSSIRLHDSGYTSKDEVDKIKRDSEQQRAQIRVELTQKWQSEIDGRKVLESHITMLEKKLSGSRRITNGSVDSSNRIKELEGSLEDARRRLTEERQIKENFEDLLSALKGDLEQHRNERDNLRDEVVPKLRLQLEGLEVGLAESHKQVYEHAKTQQEIERLREENFAMSNARKIEQEMRGGMEQIAEDDDLSSIRSSLVLPKSTGLNRSNTVSGRSTAKGTLSRSSSLSKTTNGFNRPLPENPESITDKLNAVEQQRDALQATARHLRKRLEHDSRKYEKQIISLRLQIERTDEHTEVVSRGGYEKEVRTLRQEINLLRKRADEALDQKWQCEKGLSGLKMDLDRSKQETASLQQLLQAREIDDPEAISDALQQAINELEQARLRNFESVISLVQEQELSQQLQESAERSEALAAQVRAQLEANSSLRIRLMGAVESGEKNQQTSAAQISQLQSKLKRLEDTITSAQIQSETAVMKHEEELRMLKQSHNAQLQRAKAGLRSPVPHNSGSRTPLSPMLANSKRSPRIDQTSSGPGQTLNQSLKTEFLETKVSELEKALHDAEHGMEEVVGRMNQAQIGVFELQQERDEALKRTKQLEADVQAERERFQSLITAGYPIPVSAI